jgi:hypothetical protein
VLQQGEIAVMGPASVASYRTPPDLRMLTLYLPMSRLEPAFQATCQQDLDSLVCETRIIDLSPSLLKRLTRIERQEIGATPSTSSDAARAIWQRELEASFVTCLINGLAAGDKPEPRANNRHSDILSIACVFQSI